MSLTKLEGSMLAPSAQTPLPISAKGQLVVHNGTAAAAQPAPSEGQVLVGRAASATGWSAETPAAGYPVGTMVLGFWSTIPAAHLELDASAVSRTTYSALYDAVTLQLSGTTHSNTTVDNIASTANLRAGMPLEGSGIPAGTFIASVDSATAITISQAASASATVTLRYFPWGNGDGSTTFNLPDAAGRVPLIKGSGVRKFSVLAVNTGTDEITIRPQLQIVTGMALVYTSSGSAIGGLTPGATYYAIADPATPNKIKLASTRALAIQVAGGTWIDLTSSGSGTQELTFSLSDRRTGDLLGEESHALSLTELVAHTHSGGVSGGGSSSGSGTRDLTVNTGSTGGNQPHNNMPPALCLRAAIYAGV